MTTQRSRILANDAKWIEVTVERYDEMLGVLPPADMSGIGFLVGEPMDHNGEGRPRYTAFIQCDERYFESRHAMTRREFRSISLPVGSPS